MNKKKFLKKLTRLLRRLPEEEREAALRYYREYFDEAGNENEQRVIEELGSPEKVAEEILQGSSQNAGEIPPVPARKGPNAALVVLVVLLAIVEICLLIGFLAADIAILGIGFVLVLNITDSISLLTIVIGGILVALAITLVFTALTIWAIRATFRLTRSDTEERRN